MRRILVTGAATWTGGRVVAALERRPGVEVYAVDEMPPRGSFSSPFITMGADRAALADHVLRLRPETIVHLLTVDRSDQFGAGEAHERAVVGNQALFGAAGRCDELRQVVVRSDAAVYPLGPRNPSILTEAAAERPGGDRTLLDVERATAQFGSRRPDVAVTVLRMAPVFGRTVDNPLSRYLRLPVVPTLLGFDPRWHLLHEDDAVAALLAAVDGDATGVVNVAPDGPMYLSRVIRLGRRIEKPLLGPALTVAHRALERTGSPVPARLRLLLEHGVVLDTTAMHRDLGFSPTHTMRRAVYAGYADGAGGEP